MSERECDYGHREVVGMCGMGHPVKPSAADVLALREAAVDLIEVESRRFTGYYSNSRSPDENGNRSANSRFQHAYFEAVHALADALREETP